MYIVFIFSFSNNGQHRIMNWNTENWVENHIKTGKHNYVFFLMYQSLLVKLIFLLQSVVFNIRSIMSELYFWKTMSLTVRSTQQKVHVRLHCLIYKYEKMRHFKGSIRINIPAAITAQHISHCTIILQISSSLNQAPLI